MRSFCKKGDRGFSLVELIVVILIMGVLGGGSVAAVSSIYHANAERAAKKLIDLMDVARTKAMALDNGSTYITFRVYNENEDNYAGVYLCTPSNPDGELIEPASPQKLSNYRVTIKVGTKNTPLTGGTAIDEEIPAQSFLEYRFKKSSGGIASVTFGHGEGSSFATNESDAAFYKDIIIEGASSYKVIVVPATGRCYLSNE